MDYRRIIPCLDVKDGRLVKGINFVQLKDVGDPAENAAVGEFFFDDGGCSAHGFQSVSRYFTDNSRRQCRDNKREFGQIIVIRCIESTDARNATITPLPWEKLNRISERITQIAGVNRCLYDLTPKPPATIEYV